jgi:hypothetical protein
MKQSAPSDAPDANDEAVVDLTDHLRGRAKEIGELLSQRYRDNIVEYRSLSDSFMERDVAAIAVENLEEMLAALARGDGSTGVRLDVFRNSSSRRFRQGVPLQALLHAYRLWGQTVWEEVMRAPVVQSNPAVGLIVAARVMEHVDVVSTVVAEAYLEEATGVIQDRELVRRDLLESLIAGAEVTERIARYLRSFGLDPQEPVAVLLVRNRRLGSTTPESLRSALKHVRAYLDGGQADRPLIGVRDEEIVVIHPVGALSQTELRSTADGLAESMPRFVVGSAAPGAASHRSPTDTWRHRPLSCRRPP